MCSFLLETLDSQSAGLEIAALVTEVSSETSQMLFSTALARHTAAVMGWRKGEERGGHCSYSLSQQLCPGQMDHQSQLLHLFLCASIWIIHCLTQISKALRKISSMLPAPSAKPSAGVRHPKTERGNKEGVCKHLQVAAHQCMQSFSSRPVLPSQSKN